MDTLMCHPTTWLQYLFDIRFQSVSLLSKLALISAQGMHSMPAFSNIDSPERPQDYRLADL